MLVGRCWRKVSYVLSAGSALLLLAMTATPVQAEAHKFSISDVVCKYLACQPRDVQEGLTALEVEGEDFGKWAGSYLTFRVYRLEDPDHGDIVIDSKVDVSRSGHFVTNVPVYDLADGNYYLAFYAAEAPGKPVATGIFRRTTAESRPQNGSAESGRSQDRKAE
jgi:hypothetical protein